MTQDKLEKYIEANVKRVHGRKNKEIITTWIMVVNHTANLCWDLMDSLTNLAYDEIDTNDEFVTALLPWILKRTNEFRESLVLYQAHPMFHMYKKHVLDESISDFLEQFSDYLSLLSQHDASKESKDIYDAVCSIVDEAVRNTIKAAEEKYNAEEYEDENEEDDSQNVSARFLNLSGDKRFSVHMRAYNKIRMDLRMKLTTLIMSIGRLHQIVIGDLTEIIAGRDIWRDYKKSINRYNDISRIKEIKFLNPESFKKVGGINVVVERSRNERNGVRKDI
jgi:hypothetical protein